VTLAVFDSKTPSLATNVNITSPEKIGFRCVSKFSTHCVKDDTFIRMCS
jgi:hypothetical protein